LQNVEDWGAYVDFGNMIDEGAKQKSSHVKPKRKRSCRLCKSGAAARRTSRERLMALGSCDAHGIGSGIAEAVAAVKAGLALLVQTL
jgi:hypothetical protein